MHLFQFLRLRRSRPRTPLVDSSPSPRLDISQEGTNASIVMPGSLASTPGDSTGAARDIPARFTPWDESASRLASASQLVTLPIVQECSNLTQIPCTHGSIAHLPTALSQTTISGLCQDYDLLSLPPHSSAPTAAPRLEESRLPQGLTSHLPQHSREPQEGNPGISHGPLNIGPLNILESRNVSVDGNRNTVTYMNTVIGGSNNFMKELLEKTIPGAAFNSSARDPPPRCHPGTRLAILGRLLDFIVDCSGKKKMRWVVGAAGVGKSAIMQSIAESPLPPVALRASIFFFLNGRTDGTKAIVTLAYQLAAKSEAYRQFIEHELTCDPSLLQSSMSEQFNKFIIGPFIHHPRLNSVGRVLILIDGLDECDKSHTQRELLHLISDFCVTYPSSSIVWIIASRPEPHIASFFSQALIKAVFEKEEILVDSDEARQDVERFLRSELAKIQSEFSLNPGSQWPSELDFLKLANASGGLFVYAHTVVNYTGDPDIGNPALRLNDVLKVIDAHPLPDVPREQHPMALLDALYAQILSKVPDRIMVNTRKILLVLVLDGFLSDNSFIALCNWIDLTPDDAYAAIRHLRSILKAPGRAKAHGKQLRFFHKSFIDYILDSTRSGFSPDINQEAYQLQVRCTSRVLEEASDGIDFGEVDYYVSHFGTLARGPGTGRNISLTWPVDEGVDWDDNRIRLGMYKTAIANVVRGIEKNEPAFCTAFCIRLLATRFGSYPSHYPFRGLQSSVFDKSRRQEFMEAGIIQQVPIEVFDVAHIDIYRDIKLRFRRLTTRMTDLSDPWNSSCTGNKFSVHERKGTWRDGGDQDWTTEFGMGGTLLRRCHFCCQRLEHQLERWKTSHPDHLVPVLFTSTGTCFVEFEFVDPEDGISEWAYRFVYKFSLEQRKNLGSVV